eukprot:gene30745-34696_t
MNAVSPGDHLADNWARIIKRGVVSAAASSMIPLTKDGHAYHRGNLASKTVVEMFIDLTCSSCLQSWPLLTKVYEAYKDAVHFEYRVFPLPYHQQAFIVSKAAQL